MGKLRTSLRNYLVAGVLVLAPIGLTVWLIRVLFTLANAMLSVKDGYYLYIIPAEYHPEALWGIRLPFLGLLLALAIVLLTGILARNFVGRKLIQFGEDIVRRIPVVRSIYTATKQLFGTVLNAQAQNFRQVVLVEYPRKGLHTLGFISGSSFRKVQEKFDEELVSIFVPTTPNPTSGFYMLAPKKDLIELDISTEEAFKAIISFGIVTPDSADLDIQEITNA